MGVELGVFCDWKLHLQKKHQILIGFIITILTAPERWDNPLLSHLMFNQIVWATFTPRVPSMLPRHGMIKPVLSLYSFLRPSCFLDCPADITRHNFGFVQRLHFCGRDLSMSSFSGSATCPAPASRQSSIFGSAPRPRTWRMASFAYTVSGTPFFVCLSVRPCTVVFH